MITGSFDMVLLNGDAAAQATGYLNLDGSNQLERAILATDITGQEIDATIVQTWFVTVSAQPKVAKLRGALIATGTGAALDFVANDTNIKASYLGT